MKHLPTTVLLDLAEDYQVISRTINSSLRIQRESAIVKLGEIDTELLSRMPEGEFVTLYDRFKNVHINGVAYHLLFEPVGFEPYIGEDNEYLTYLAIERQLYEQAQLDDSSYYFYRD